MGGRTERCTGCGLQLVVPWHAKTIRCAACGAITNVRSKDPLVRLLKGLIAHVSSSVNSYGSPPSSSYQQGSGYMTYPLQPPPTYPSAHGKKRALLIGVSYTSRRYELKGTVNDVNCMKYLLREKFGFPDDCILVLTEEDRDPYRTPTKQNMRAAMHWLVRGSRHGDSLLFHFSGHGSQQPNFNGDEIDGYDETLCPLDYEANGMIIDDEINATIVRPLLDGVKLHSIIDACHSGTALDLPYLCKMNRGGYYQWEDHSQLSRVNKGTSGGLAICFSGCDDSQTSADTSAFSRNATTGAMTYSFIQSVESEPGTTYGRMLNAMRSAIREADTLPHFSGPIASLIKRTFNCGLTQEPQLSSSERFDIYRKPFIL